MRHPLLLLTLLAAACGGDKSETSDTATDTAAATTATSGATGSAGTSESASTGSEYSRPRLLVSFEVRGSCRPLISGWVRATPPMLRATQFTGICGTVLALAATIGRHSGSSEAANVPLANFGSE